MPEHAPLRLFLPGAFANLGEAIRAGFARAQPGVTIEFHEFIPSGLLAREIRAGAPADVYVSANRQYMDELERDGLIAESRLLAGNRLCIIARPDAVSRVNGLLDLVEPDVRVVVPQAETDPCGQYVAAMFRERGMEPVMRAKHQAGTLLYSRGSGDLPGFLADGRAQAGIFYASEVGALGRSVVEIPLPRDADFRERITFTVGRVAHSGVHSAAGAMLDWLTGSNGRRLLTEHGFMPPPK